MATIVVFASALFVASFLVLMKALELKHGKRNFLLGLLGKMDALSIACVSALKFRGLQLVQTIRYIVLVQAKEACRNWFYKTQEKIISEYKTRHNEIMGRKDIANKGSVSFYLKKITEDRGNGNKGKIEEGL